MIHLRKLSKYYGELCAVDQVDLDINSGKVLGLLGPNGAGKSTILRMLTGYFKPTSGSIRVKEFDMGKDALEIKKMIGYLPESAPLYHNMLVYDYLNFIAGMQGLNKSSGNSRIRELVNLCKLHEVIHKPVSELSKGYKQRVGLAHAMMGDPEILILDEPTSGLDPNQIVEIREIIKEIGKEKTIIFSSHILSEVEATCDRIIIIHQGKIVGDGDAEALKGGASQENTINISLKNANFNDVKKNIQRIDSMGDVKKEGGINNGILKITVSCKKHPGIMEHIYKEIKQQDWILLEFYQETKTLEKIFRELTMEA